MPSPGNQLQLQREALRRGLWRASLASVVVLLVVVALALGVAWKAEQFQREGERARAASARAESELWNAKLNEATARRMAGGAGARVESAALLGELVRRPDLREEQILALRRERIAQLALVDIVMAGEWIPVKAGSFNTDEQTFWGTTSDDRIFWDETLTRYARQQPDRQVAVYSYPEEKVLRVLSGYTNALIDRAVFSPAGDLLAVRFRDGQVRVWRLADADVLFAIRGTSEGYYYHHPYFSPDGQLLGIHPRQAIMEKGQGLHVYDPYSGKLRAVLNLRPASP